MSTVIFTWPRESGSVTLISLAPLVIVTLSGFFSSPLPSPPPPPPLPDGSSGLPSPLASSGIPSPFLSSGFSGFGISGMDGVLGGVPPPPPPVPPPPVPPPPVPPPPVPVPPVPLVPVLPVPLWSLAGGLSCFGGASCFGGSNGLVLKASTCLPTSSHALSTDSLVDLQIASNCSYLPSTSGLKVPLSHFMDSLRTCSFHTSPSQAPSSIVNFTKPATRRSSASSSENTPSMTCLIWSGLRPAMSLTFRTPSRMVLALVFTSPDTVWQAALVTSAMWSTASACVAARLDMSVTNFRDASAALPVQPDQSLLIDFSASPCRSRESWATWCSSTMSMSILWKSMSRCSS